MIESFSKYITKIEVEVKESGKKLIILPEFATAAEATGLDDMIRTDSYHNDPEILEALGIKSEMISGFTALGCFKVTTTSERIK